MARRYSRGPQKHSYRNKLLLNQWLISLFGIDTLRENKIDGRKVRPFHMLSELINDPKMEGLDHDNLHIFYHNLVNSNLFWDDHCTVKQDELLKYDENIVSHTQRINEKRSRPITWKYFQWLSLVFMEIYLDWYFRDRDGLLSNLNTFVDKFNHHWSEYIDVALFTEDDLNKLCLQMATGSGKTLLMHVNLLQYRHYAKQYGKDKDLSRVILLTPNERLSEQHISEFRLSGISADHYLQTRGGFFGAASGLDRIDVLEITKLAEQEGPNTIDYLSFGDQNLLLVDEGHRGMSGTQEGAWFSRRAALCSKGFTIEYSATFEQAVASAKNDDFENSYSKSVLFDYSYRWFYEDGFGKDYHILNIPKTLEETEANYLTACLLKYYQQLRIYQEKHLEFEPFNIEKPLWVFVGSTVTKAKGGSKTDEVVAADVAKIIQFITAFLHDPETAKRRIESILTGNGRDTGLIDKSDNDIFVNSFNYLITEVLYRKSLSELYRDIIQHLFNHTGGGNLHLYRLKGESGEILLKVGSSEEAFGLINVGDASGLCKHCEEVCENIVIEETDFNEAIFASVKESSSPINLLIGSKKFIEGWDCWRVSTMGLMHVGQSEGTQIIQLFGRGVRLKGYGWSLKRSGKIYIPQRPVYIEELETLNVFGIEADFMEKFRSFLEEEGLPGNERYQVYKIPLNVTYDVSTQLKILRPKRKRIDGKEYDFKKDGPVVRFGEIPDYLYQNPVIADWYPRIMSVQSHGHSQAAQKDLVTLSDIHLALLDYDRLYIELEQFKRERGWYNLNVSSDDLRLVINNRNWYRLYIPSSRINPINYSGIVLIQQIVTELLKRYLDHLYNYCKRAYIEPRLELRILQRSDDNLPQDKEYQLIVEESQTTAIEAIKHIKAELEQNKDHFLQIGDLCAGRYDKHLYEPLLHLRPGGTIVVEPVSLNESEFQFVKDLKQWSDLKTVYLEENAIELFLLRNLSRGKGIGFFEAGNFHPDFILWAIYHGKQYVSFIEPHGLRHEVPASEKIQLYRRIKDIELRLGDPDVILNSFVLSWSRFPELKWDLDQAEMEQMHVLFMNDGFEQYISKMFDRILLSTSQIAV